MMRDWIVDVAVLISVASGFLLYIPLEYSYVFVDLFMSSSYDMTTICFSESGSYVPPTLPDPRYLKLFLDFFSSSFLRDE